jgi:WD40 repeat protein
MEKRTAKKYKTFISYRHSETSRLFARSIEGGLKAYAKPLFQFPMKVFRDESELLPGADLKSTILKALEQSDFLILLANKESAESPWVQDELMTWCALSERIENLIIVCVGDALEVDGKDAVINWDKTNALPILLQTLLPSAPLFVDLRWAKTQDDLSLSNIRFKEAINAVSARLSGKTPYEMNGVEIKTTRRNRQLRSIAIATMATLFTIAVGLGLYSNKQRNLAETRATIADSRRVAILAENRRNISLDQALLLSTHAYRTFPTYEARKTLWGFGQMANQLSRFIYYGDGAHFNFLALNNNTLANLTDQGLDLLRFGDVEGSIKLASDEQVNGVGLAYLPNSQELVASGNKENQLHIWNLSSRKKVDSLLFPFDETIFDIAVSSSEEFIAGSSSNGHAVVWRRSTRQPIDTISLPRLDEVPETVDAMVFHPQLPILYYSTGHMLAARDLVHHKILYEREIHRKNILQLIWHHDRLYSLDESGIIKTWTAGADSIHYLQGIRTHESGAKGMAVSYDGGHLVTIGMVDDSIFQYETEGLQRINAVHYPNGNAWKVDFLGTTNQFVIQGSGKFSIWNWEFGPSRIQTIDSLPVSDEFQIQLDHFGEWYAYISDGQICIVILDPVAPNAVASRTTLTIPKLQYHGGNALAAKLNEVYTNIFCLSHDRKKLALVGQDKIIIYEVANKVPLHEFPIPKDAKVTEMALSPEGDKLAVEIGNVIYAIDLLNSELHFEVGQYKMNGVGGLFYGSKDELAFCAWHPFVVTNRNEQTPLLQNLEMQEMMPANRIASSPSGTYAVCGYDFERSILLWDLQTFEPFQAPITGYNGGPICFSSDGKRLLEFDFRKGIIKHYDIDFDTLSHRLSKKVTRKFTPVEITKFGL